MSDELTIDKKSGALVPVGEVSPDEEIELSIFGDGRDFEGSGIRAYSLQLKIGGTTFFGNELGASDLEYVTAENKAIAAASRALKTTKQSEQQAAGEAVARRNVALAEWVMERAITGWNNPKWTKPIPYDAENRKAMSNSAKIRVSDDVVAKSYSGRSAGDAAESF